MDILLSLLPIIAILVLMLAFKWAADTSGLIGWSLSLILAYFFFSTPPEVLLKSSLAGAVRSFPISLMVAASIFQISFLEKTGLLKRISTFVKTISTEDHVVQILIVNMGVGTLLVSVGATPVSMLPPIMIALGYSSFLAIALPALGWDSLCTYALLGTSLVIFSDITGTSLNDSALIFSKFLPFCSVMIGFGMMWLVGGWKKIREGWFPTLIAGLSMGLTAVAVAHIGKGIVLTGVIAGIICLIVMSVYLKLRGKRIIDDSHLGPEDRNIQKTIPLSKALSAWIILIVLLVIINFWPSLFTFLYKTIAMPFSIIPGKPIMTRMIWNAYTWVVISTILASVFIRPTGAQWLDTCKAWLKRAPRPVLSAMVFFCIAEVLNYSGYIPTADGWKLPDNGNNMIYVLASGCASIFRGAYPVVAAYLGQLGGFISGSETSAIALFAKCNSITAGIIGKSSAIITAATAVCAGLASVMSPAKLQNAAASIDRIGEEAHVLRKVIWMTMIMVAVCAVLALLWA